MAGANNTAKINTGAGNYIIGFSNEQSNTGGSSYIFGENNKKVRHAIVIGFDNGSNAWDGIGSSYQNLVIGYKARSACREGIVLGNNLAGQGYAIGTTILGTNNKKDNSDYGLTERIDRSSSSVIVGAGTSNNRLNAIEVNNAGLVAFPHGLCLDSVDTTVNAITPPRDPDFVSQDDQTLVTLGYLSRFTPTDGAKVYAMGAADLPSSVVLPADGSTIAFANGGIYDDPPEWANRVQVTILWEGEYFTPTIVFDRTGGIHLDVKQTDTTMQPDLVIRHAHIRLDYQSTNKTLQILDYWEYSHNITNNTISNIITGISNAAPVYIPRIDYLNG